MENNILRLSPKDNLIVALNHLSKGSAVRFNDHHWILQEDIPAKHKFAAQDLEPGSLVWMYGVVVGRAVKHIPGGGLITTSNIIHETSQPSMPTDFQVAWQAPDVTPWRDRQFMGYPRPDGRTGVANYWVVIPLVFCENRNVDVIREALIHELGYGKNNHYRAFVRQWVQSHSLAPVKDEMPSEAPQAILSKPFPRVDGIRFLTHQGGCGGTREDTEMLVRLLAGYVTHPNVAGATILSLGCQHAQADLLRKAVQAISPNDSRPLIFLEQQQSISEDAFIKEAIQKTLDGLAVANTCARVPSPLSALTLGLECGGSDGFSGISANPVVGHVSDMMVALGGSAILAEFPELAGVEQHLLDRMLEAKQAQTFMHLMHTYQQAAHAVGSGFEANPSPGNIRDGLITDAIKSAGAAKKGGSSPIVDVLDYTDQLRASGLNLLCTPGNDVESTTALAASGAQIILFTTGLGTPTGNPVAPVLKIASNTSLASRMADIIDFDAGPVVHGNPIPPVAGALFELVFQTAEGTYMPKAVRLEQHDFIPWKRGISL